MSDYLDQIGQRIEAATEGPWSVYRTRVGTYVTRPDLLGVAREWSLVWQDADAEFIANARADLPRLLAAIRAAQAAIAGVELDVRLRSDWEDGRAALAQEIRVAITDALEGERMSAVCVACGRVRTTEQDYHPIQVFTGGPFGWFSGDSEEMCPECFTKLMRKANG